MMLESHIFLKGGTVSGGNKQCMYIPKEDSSSPNVTTESVLLTTIVNTEKNRDAAVIDIPNAFIQTSIEEKSE